LHVHMVQGKLKIYTISIMIKAYGDAKLKNSTRVGIIVCLAILLAFSLSMAFAAEKTNVTKSVNMTNTTKNLTNMDV